MGERKNRRQSEEFVPDLFVRCKLEDGVVYAKDVEGGGQPDKSRGQDSDVGSCLEEDKNFI